MTKNELIQILLDETKSGELVWTNPRQGDYETRRKGATITVIKWNDGRRSLTVARDHESIVMNIYDDDPSVPELVTTIKASADQVETRESDALRAQLMADPPPTPPAPPTFWQRLRGRQ